MLKSAPTYAGAALLASILPATAVAIPYSAELSPLNDSGVSGSAALDLDLDSETLSVSISASGLEAGMPHPQHIHGALSGEGNPVNSTTPTIAQDDDEDGLIEVGEGQATYGPILLPLTSPPGSGLAGFPTAPGGSIDFFQTYDLTDTTIFNADFDAGDLGEDLALREIVLHGRSVEAGIGEGTPGAVDGSGGYTPTLPVAAGEITEQTASVPEPGTLSLLGLGLLGLGALRRGRHSD